MNLFIVDDHPLFRDGLRLALRQRADLHLLGEASTVAGAFQQIVELRPDLVLADVHMADGSGIELTARLSLALPTLKVLILSGDSDPALIQSALDAGARGYVLKETVIPVLMHAMEMVQAGKVFISPEVSGPYIEFVRNRTAAEEPPKLEVTDRERDVLRLIAAGQRNKEIAARLELSTKSIETYRSRLMKKLGCSSPAELVRYAIRTGIAPL